MNLKEKIQQDLKQAMLAKDELKRSTLRMISSAILYQEKGISAQYQATDEEVLKILNKQLKAHEESIQMFKKGGREELAEKEKQELEIIKTYLPEQMSKEEVRKIIEETVQEIGATSMQEMGKVLAAVNVKVKGKASSSLVAGLVREKLHS